MTADPDPGEGFISTVPFETEGCAAAVEVTAGMVVLRLLVPSTSVAVTLTRREARAMALALIDASQQILAPHGREGG